jgi:hypothetical protein
MILAAISYTMWIFFVSLTTIQHLRDTGYIIIYGLILICKRILI